MRLWAALQYWEREVRDRCGYCGHRKQYVGYPVVTTYTTRQGTVHTETMTDYRNECPICVAPK